MSHDSQQLGIDPALVREEQNSRTFCLCGRNPRQRCFSRGADSLSVKILIVKKTDREGKCFRRGRKEGTAAAGVERGVDTWMESQACETNYTHYFLWWTPGNSDYAWKQVNFYVMFLEQEVPRSRTGCSLYKGVPYKPYSVYCKKNWDTNWQ